MIFKDNDIELKVMNIIETNHNSNAYILLIKNMLIVGTDLLYLYDIGDNKNINKISSFNIRAKCWNSMIIINADKNLIGVGSGDRILILQINDFLQFKIIKEININYESSCYDALCLYQNDFLIIGMRYGNIHIFDINNNYELINTIKDAHKVIKDSDASINGIIELSDGVFASYGEDKKIKIW
jgi:WD40 repeat protein